MTRFRRQFLIGAAALTLSAATAALLYSHSPSAGPNAGNLERTVYLGAVATLGMATVALAAYVALVLTGRLERDLEQLRAIVRHLAHPEKDPPDVDLSFEELGALRDELARVAQVLRRHQARLNEDASSDPLTGLPNRRTFIYTLARETAFALRTGWPLSVVMVDLDHFKLLNDQYGHQAGDFVLVRTARRLASLVRQSDVVARIGGEEFVVILPGTRLDRAMQIAEQLRAALNCDQLIFQKHEMHITASFGVAELQECGLSDPDAIIRLADEALYEAKRLGRDRVVAAPRSLAVPGDGPQPAPHESAEQTPGSGEAATLDHQSPDDNTPVDRDTMALMGSIFSILQVIPDRHRVAQDVIQQVGAVLHSTDVSLHVLDDRTGTLVTLSAMGGDEFLEPGKVRDDLQTWFDDLRSRGPSFPTRSVEPSVIESPELGITQVRLPLVVYGTVFGVIQAEAGSQEEFFLGRRQRTVLAALCAIGATALRNCDAYKQTEERWSGLVEVVCTAIQANDAYKRDHASRVANVSVKLAKAMGQHDEEALLQLRVAALMHDIGKIGLPDRLFSKRGRLRSSERKQLEDHCRIGAEIVESVSNMHRLADVVRHHHEHYDGGGYPDHLAGDEIPIESRIIAVADAYEAITSERPYRSALPHEEALKRIREASGTQFDPAVVTALLATFGEDRSIPMPIEAEQADTPHTHVNSDA